MWVISRLQHCILHEEKPDAALMCIVMKTMLADSLEQPRPQVNRASDEIYSRDKLDKFINA